jgi:hypothetical protein
VHLLVAFLIFLVVLVVVTAIVIFILQQLAPQWPWARNVCLAVAALILLIWLVSHYAEIVGSFHA